MAAKPDLVKVKEKAARAFTRGHWEKALENYEILVKYQPRDLRLKMKLGDVFVKLKKMNDAFAIYEEVGDAYAKDGFLIQAISVYKLLQQLDPKRPGVTDKLQELNQARGIPATPTPAAAPPDQRSVRRAIDALSDLEHGRVLDEAPANGASYGLSNAEIRLTIYDENGERIDRLLCTRHEIAPAGYVVTSEYSGVAAVIDEGAVDAAVGNFKNLQQP